MQNFVIKYKIWDNDTSYNSLETFSSLEEALAECSLLQKVLYTSDITLYFINDLNKISKIANFNTFQTIEPSSPSQAKESDSASPSPQTPPSSDTSTESPLNPSNPPTSHPVLSNSFSETEASINNFLSYKLRTQYQIISSNYSSDPLTNTSHYERIIRRPKIYSQYHFTEIEQPNSRNLSLSKIGITTSKTEFSILSKSSPLSPETLYSYIEFLSNHDLKFHTKKEFPEFARVIKSKLTLLQTFTDKYKNFHEVSNSEKTPEKTETEFTLTFESLLEKTPSRYAISIYETEYHDNSHPFSNYNGQISFEKFSLEPLNSSPNLTSYIILQNGPSTETTKNPIILII